MSLVNQIKAARGRGVPLIAIQTSDPAMTISTVSKAVNGDAPKLQWDYANGLRSIDEHGAAALSECSLEKGHAQGSAGDMLESAPNLPKKTVLFIHLGHKLLDNAPMVQATWNLRDLFKTNQRMLILLGTQFNIPPELQGDIVLIDEPLPTAEQLAEIVIKMHIAAKLEAPDLAKTNRAVEAVQGLPAFAAEQAVAMSLTKDGLNLDSLWERKRQQIESTPGLKVYRGGDTFAHIGGLRQVKDYLEALIGGKSNPSAIVWLDEIDKAMSGDIHDTSGVSQDQLGSTLTYMEDNQVLGIMLVGAPGTGKCFGKGTPILTYSGEVKPVEDIKPDDLLIGPDSKPRQVLGVTCGEGELFRITPVKGDPYIVNKDHVLSLKISPQHGGTHELVNITVSDFLQKPEWWRSRAKGWRVGVEWAARGIRIDPYILGIWLGDGDKNGTRIVTADQEVVSAFQAYADNLGLTLKTGSPRGAASEYRISKGKGTRNYRGNHFLERLRDYGLLGNKFIPEDFLINSRANRLQLLAGLIDSDGHMSCNGYEIVQKRKLLSEQIVFLARSLGFCASITLSRKTCCNNGKIGYYYRVFISGHTNEIPGRVERKKAAPRDQCKDVLVTGITVESIGDGVYYGFEVSDDHLFLLGDFTVTHNSAIAKATGNNIGLPTIRFDMSACKGSLVGQSEQQFRQALKVISAVSNDRPMFIATANDVSHLNSALKRRFPFVFFFDLPTDEEKAVIWKVWQNKYELVEQARPNDTGWSGANIQKCCECAYRLGRSLTECAKYIVPCAKQNGKELELLRQQANKTFLSASDDGVYEIKKPEVSRTLDLT